jgi:heat shock protein HtpX
MAFSVLGFKLKMYLTVISIFLLGFAIAIGFAGLVFGFRYAPAMITGILSFIFIMSLIQWLFAPFLINYMYRAIEVTPDDPQYGWLVNIVNEVAMRNRIKTPKVYIADVPIPNAFAYGSPIAGKRVAITLPALKILSRDEIKAVLGHEIGHLRHRDVEVVMAVGLIPTLLYWLGYTITWSGVFSGGNGRNGNNIALLYLIGLALIALSFIFNLLVLYINRLRETYADINAVQTVEGSAENLQLALAKLVLSADPEAIERYKKKTTISMLFFNMSSVEEISTSRARELVEIWKRTKVSILDEILSTHPHPARRIQLLEKFKY